MAVTILFKLANKLTLLLILTTVTLLPAVSQADSISEYKIKAAFIYNFARFTTWRDDDDELRVCVYGDDPFGSDLDRLEGKQTNQRTIKIYRTRLIDEIKACHIAFLNIIPPERRLYMRALNEIRDVDVLTISEADNAVDFGVMIQLTIKDNKVAFDVNQSSLQASNISISAKLLRLANKVL